MANPHPLLTQAFSLRDDDARYLKVDVSEADKESSPYVMLPVQSLFGRYADQRMLAEYPELGGFELPALHYTVTAGNKMRAMVDNCDRGRIDQIRSRARDLFDLASIAASPNAAQDMDQYIRAAEVTAGARNDAAGQYAEAVARFADNPALTPGTAENDALRDGYVDVVERLAWQPDEAPSFDQATTAAQSLTA